MCKGWRRPWGEGCKGCKREARGLIIVKGVEGGRSGDGYKGCKREVRGMMVVKGVKGGRREKGARVANMARGEGEG